MHELDELVIAMLRGTPDAPLQVFDIEAPADREAKVVTVPKLPYVVYLPAAPVDGEAQVYSGDTTARETEFDVMYVGGDRAQARAAQERAEGRIRRRCPGPGFGLMRRVDASRIRRDPNYTLLGGAPLFYGVDRYAVTV